MESLREAVLPLYKDYSIVQRRGIIAQNIAKFTMGRQEVRILYCGFGLFLSVIFLTRLLLPLQMTASQLQSALRNSMGITISLPDVVAAVADLSMPPARSNTVLPSQQQQQQQQQQQHSSSSTTSSSSSSSSSSSTSTTKGPRACDL